MENDEVVSLKFLYFMSPLTTFDIFSDTGLWDLSLVCSKILQYVPSRRTGRMVTCGHTTYIHIHTGLTTRKRPTVSSPLESWPVDVPVLSGRMWPYEKSMLKDTPTTVLFLPFLTSSPDYTFFSMTFCDEQRFLLCSTRHFLYNW